MENTKEITSLDTRCWASVLESMKYTFKGWVKEVVEEVISDKMCTVNLEDKRLNTEELCQRWNISKQTLEKWEKDGRIERLPLGGRKKLFSMAAILRAESEGLIRTAC